MESVATIFDDLGDKYIILTEAIKDAARSYAQFRMKELMMRNTRSNNWLKMHGHPMRRKTRR